MAAISGKAHLYLLFLFTLSILAQARLSLLHSDFKALEVVLKGLGTNEQLLNMQNPCKSVGVLCERRISNNSYKLRVTALVFKSRQLTGFLSPAIGQLSELKELSLPNNHLFDQLPPQLVGCWKLEILTLRNNQFSSKVPQEVSSLVRLRVLDLSSNKLSGDLDFLKHFPNLEQLLLEDNMFSGKVPAPIRSFRNLRSFNISGNSFLEGPIPIMKPAEYLSAELTEKKAFPKRYILAENSSARNRSSAMPPAQSPGPTSNTAQAPGPSATGHEHKEHKRNLGKWIGGFLIGTLAGSVCGLVFTVLVQRKPVLIRDGKEDSGPAIFNSLIKKEDLAFLRKQDGVASLEVIGRGGCGEVYRTWLPGSYDKRIAIKKMIQTPTDSADLTEKDNRRLAAKMRQIKSEIQTIGEIRHRNILPVLGHVSQNNCQYLLYEYMHNGSLQDILVRVSDGTGELGWLARHRIAVGVAAGLEYLHMSHNPRIIHRDLKPANILLDDDMEPRITDFGLAKALPDAYTHVTTSNVAGTLGYIAPEYRHTWKITEKCDIFSFGVVLGVLVIGKFPYDEFFQHTTEIGLVRWTRKVMKSEDPKKAIDPKLIGNGYEEQMLLVLEIAGLCTLDDPKQRPNSKDVSRMLSQIKH